MICGLEASTSGKILINSEDVTSLEAAKRGVSMVFQSYALFPHLSVEENIQFGLKVRKVPKAERISRTKDAADIVGLSGLLDRKPANLSGGQRQRGLPVHRRLNRILSKGKLIASKPKRLTLKRRWINYRYMPKR